ncbi:unnamed protein product [Amaranthus hypochondriacus]
MTVSWARYNRNGRKFDSTNTTKTSKNRVHGGIKNPAFRDGRKYVEVLCGSRKQNNHVVEHMKNNNESGGQRSSSPRLLNAQNRRTQSSKPAQVNLNVLINPVTEKRLELAVVIMLNGCCDAKTVADKLSKSDVPIVYLASLSTSRVIIFFDNEQDLETAMEKTSPLRTLFRDVRRWSENEAYFDRLVWIECVGLHPICWGKDNFSKIGEIWGETIRVNDVYNGVCSLTSAKILVRTKHHEKIEESVKVVWETGSCFVWVRELDYDCLDEAMSVSSASSDDLSEQDNFEEGAIMTTQKVEHLTINGNNTNTISEHVNDEEGVELRCQQVHHLNANGNINNTVCRDIVSNMENGDAFCEEHYNNINDEAICGSIVVERRANEKNLGRGSNLGECTLVECSGQQQKDSNADTQQNVLEDHIQLVMREVTLETPHFDPISSVEYPISLSNTENRIGCDSPNKAVRMAYSAPPKRLRGRPKRKVVHSLPDPLFVPSTPGSREDEAVETWNTAKRVDVKSSNEGAVISALRRSKRLLIMEEQNPAGPM